MLPQTITEKPVYKVTFIFPLKENVTADRHETPHRIRRDTFKDRMMIIKRDFKGWKLRADSPQCVSLPSRNKKGKNFRFRGQSWRVPAREAAAAATWSPVWFNVMVTSPFSCHYLFTGSSGQSNLLCGRTEGLLQKDVLMYNLENKYVTIMALLKNKSNPGEKILQ